MYEELVKRLRHDPESRAMMSEAADAIEELNHSLEIMANANTKLREQVPEWIPVTERLPEDYKPVLLYNGEDIATGYMHSDKRFTVNGSHFPSRPTHWMPLPEPPKEETK